MTKQNFYQGQRVGPEEMNGITAYGDASQGHLVASTLGLGLVYGYGAEAVSGFVAGINSGLAYNAQGRPLVLASGVQVNLAAHTPAVGNKTVLLGLVPAIISDSPATDSMGNTVYRLHTESVEFVHGLSLPENALPLYEVNLSPVGIIGFRLAAPLLETPLAQSQRTRGYGYNGGSPKITAPNGFEVDLLTLATRRAVFDALKPGGYAKGDILWLEPASYDTRSTPPKLPTAGGAAYPYTVPANEAFMGKARTYSEPTDYRQYALRLRALKDNPRNPNIVGAIGADWAVDDPSAIVEEGSNANGGYTMYAGGKLVNEIGFRNIGGSGGEFNQINVFPVEFTNENFLPLFFVKATPYGATSASAFGDNAFSASARFSTKSQTTVGGHFNNAAGWAPIQFYLKASGLWY